MTYVSDIATLTTALNGLGYTEIPDKLRIGEADHSQEDFTFEIEEGNPDLQDETSNGYTYSREIILRVNYTNASNAEYNANRDNFQTVIQTVKALTNFAGIIDFTYARGDHPNYSQGTFNFYYGYNQC